MTKDVFSQLSLRDPKNHEEARINMLKQQIRTWDVLDDRILALFYKVHREDFVPAEYKPFALADINIPLSHGQTMMTPKEEARALQELSIKEEDKILLMGIDSGYLLTLLSRLGAKVVYVNNDLPSFEDIVQKVTLHKLPNVTTLIGNLHQGWQDLLPFDVILLTGSLPTIPNELKEALSLNGRLFMVVGKVPVMEAMLVTRMTKNTWQETKIFETCRPRMLDVKDLNVFEF